MSRIVACVRDFSLKNLEVGNIIFGTFVQTVGWKLKLPQISNYMYIDRNFFPSIKPCGSNCDAACLRIFFFRFRLIFG